MPIKATIIADSISLDGKRITTFELEFPRIILAEFNTHRVFSRNTASTRAVPLNKAIEMLKTAHFYPNPFTKNVPGMKANDPIEDQVEAEEIWNWSLIDQIYYVEQLAELEVSKQHAGRLLEPFQYVKTAVTATEWDNWYELRDHEDAQPEIRELAKEMKFVYEKSTPILLNYTDLHVPYYKEGYWIEKVSEDSREDALKISASCCAQVSYRKLDDSIEKARAIYDRLIGSRPFHASPFEHQAYPMDLAHKNMKGYTSKKIIDGQETPIYCSGNFVGWVQYRQILGV